MKDIIDSLMSSEEVLAAIVGVTLGAAITWLANWWRQRRGNWVVINQVSQSPQITISQKVRENLKITYKDMPADQLVLSTLRMTNTSPDNLEEIHIEMTISFKDRALGTDPNSFIELEYNDPLNQTEIEREDSSSDELPGKRIYSIYRPFLKSERKYKEERIEFAVFSSDEVEISVVGGGPRWHAKFSSSKASLTRSVMTSGLTLVFLSILVSVVPSQITDSIIPFICALTAGSLILLVFITIALRRANEEVYLP